MTIAIASYRVVVSRNMDPGEVRHLYLEADDSEAGQFKHFALYFYETDPEDLGYVNPDNGYVVPFLPIREFADIYQLLRSEKQAYARWSAGGDNRLRSFQVASSKDLVRI